MLRLSFQLFFSDKFRFSGGIMRATARSSSVAQALKAGPLFIAILLGACSKGMPVTNGEGGMQSETSATTAFEGETNRIVVAFNDGANNQNLLTYTPTDRVLSSGASLMGWAYSDDKGAHWTYGGKVKPPNGWAVLWGDPAIGTSKTHYNVVFMTNLAIPSTKFPAGGIHGSLDPFPPESYIGGACIAKSTDAGKTFAIYTCVSNTDAVPGVSDSTLGHFYDGGSVVGSTTGEIFAAFVDIATQQIDVYRSPDENGTFTRIAPPFPGMYVGSHPRLRTGLDGSLYVAAHVLAEDGPHVYLNRYANGTWGKPIQAGRVSIYYPTIDFGTTVQGSELTLRAGNQLSFDIGASSADGSDAIRLLYVRQDPNTRKLFIDASACRADLSSCARVPGWGTIGDTGPGTANKQIDFYNPEVAAWPGFIVGPPPTWQASWAYRLDGRTTVNVSRATLGYANGTALYFPIDIIQDAPVCSDQRGYWGDYDSMLQVGWQETSSAWMRFLTDSSSGCSSRWEYMAKTQGIQQANYID
jgi:hypothetical protein